VRYTIIAMLAALALAGCSDQTPVAQTPPASTTSTVVTHHTAGELATALGMGTVTVWTAATDENQLLGRPGGYTSAATVTDKRLPCPDKADPGTDCGATVEVFPTDDEAVRRSEYIQSILGGGGILGTEYHYFAATALLRVTGQLTPDQAKVYAEKFQTAASR